MDLTTTIILLYSIITTIVCAKQHIEIETCENRLYIAKLQTANDKQYYKSTIDTLIADNKLLVIERDNAPINKQRGCRSKDVSDTTKNITQSS